MSDRVDDLRRVLPAHDVALLTVAATAGVVLATWLTEDRDVPALPHEIASVVGSVPSARDVVAAVERLAHTMGTRE